MAAAFERNMRDVQRVRNVRNIRTLNHKNYRNHVDPFIIYTENEFKRRYRVNKNTAKYIIDLIKPVLEPQQNRRDCISPELQVLTALRFYAKGMFQEDNGDLHGISQASVSRIVRKVSVALASKIDQFVHFPHNLNTLKNEFYAKAGFPNVVGCIDCTHVRIKNPNKEQPLLYCNRKGWYSLNVQIVCDANHRILNLNARWRGSAHDARIWAECTLARKFENGTMQGLLLGDGGYPCRQYLLTPLTDPQTRPERRYNNAHILTRGTVERCFGHWKAMFRSLQIGINISLETAKAAIAAMAVIYNIRKDFDDVDDDSDTDSDTQDEQIDHIQMPMPQPPNNARGNAFRAAFINRHFA